MWLPVHNNIPTLKEDVQVLSFSSKSYDNGQVVRGAGAIDYWKPLVMDLHGGDGSMKLILYLKKVREVQFAAEIITEQPYLGSNLVILYWERARNWQTASSGITLSLVQIK